MFRTAWVTLALLLITTAATSQNQTGVGLQSTTWTGAVDADWDNASNWTNGVPSSGVNAVVPATSNDPSTLDTVGAECAHLTIAAGASLDVPPSDRLLVFAGASIAGPISGQGLLRFVGPGQIVSPAGAPVVTPLISIAADVTLGGSLLRLTRLRLESGALEVAAGNTTRVSAQARFLGGSLNGDGVLDLNGNSFFSGTEVLDPPTIFAAGNLSVNEDFDPASGHVTMDGSGPRTVTLAGGATSARFFDFGATVGAIINTAVPFWIRGDFDLDGKFRTTGSFDLDGDLLGSGELNFQSAIAPITFGGGVDFDGILTSLAGVVFDGSGDDSLALGATTTLPDTEIAIAGTLTAVSPTVVIAGDLVLTSGEFVIDEFTSLTVQGSTTFAGGTLGGEGILDLSQGDLNVSTNSTVTFAGVDLTIDGNLNLTQGQLQIINGSVTRVQGNANFSGGSLLGTGGRLEVVGNGSGGSSNGNVRFVGSISNIPPEILLTGDWTADENFAPTQGRVIFGGATQVIQRETEGEAPLQFHRVEVEAESAVSTVEHLALGEDLFVDGNGKSKGSFDTDGDMVVEGNFTIDGSFTSTTGNLDVNGDIGGDGDINFISVTGDTTFGGDMDFGGSMSSAGMISFDGLGEHFVQTHTSTVLPPTEFEGDGTITVVGGLVQIGGPTPQPGGGGGPSNLFMRHLSGNLRIEAGTTLRILGSARFEAAGGELLGVGGTLDVDGDVVFDGTQVSTPPDMLVEGDWTAGSSVVPTSGRVRFDGAAQEILGSAGLESGGGEELQFFRVEVAPSSSTSTAENLALGENFDVQSDETGDGSFDTDGDLHVGGDFHVDGFFLSTTGNLNVGGDVTGDGDINLASVTGDTDFGGDMDFGGSVSSAGMISFNGLGDHFVQTNASTVLPPTDFEGDGTVTLKGGLIQIGAPAAAPGGGGVTPSFFLRHLAGNLEIEAGTTLRVLGSARFEAQTGELFGAGGTIDVDGDVVFDGTQVNTPPDFLVAGDWTANSDVFPTSGRVRFDGGAQKVVSGDALPLQFFRVEVAPSSATSTAEHLALGENLDVQANAAGDGSFDTDGDLVVEGNFHIDGSFLSATGNVNVKGDVTGDGDINLASVTGETDFGGDLDFGGSMSSAGMISFNGLGDHFVQTNASTVLPPTDFAGTGRMLIKGGVVQIGGPLGTGGPGEGEASDVYLRHLSGILEIEAGSTLQVHGSARLEAAGGELIGAGGQGALTVDGDLEFAGTASTNPPDIDVAGRWTADEHFQPEVGAIVLRGGESTLSSTAPGQELFFHYLVVAESRRTPTSDLVLHTASLHVGDGGELDTTQHAISIPTGMVEVGGRLVVASGGRLELGSTTDVSITPAGTFSARGEYPELAVVSGLAGGGYGFQVDGAIEAVNFVFEDMGPGGIAIGDGASLGAAPADLRGGTFRNPSAVFGSVMLDVARLTPTDFRYLSFEDPLGVGTFNVRTPLTSAAISFTNFAGNLAGEDFDNDPGEEDDSIVWNEPDVTELVFFSASPGPEVVTLDWATTKEVDTSAFVLERAAPAEGSPASLLTELLPFGPASYQFADLTALPLVVQEYRLLARLSHGPLELLGADIAMAYTTSLPPNATIVNPEVQGLFAIELAVQAVTLPNAVLIVQPGTYRPFTVTSETPGGLQIIGDPNGEVLIDTTFEPVMITGVPAGRSVEISNLVIGTGFAGLDPSAEGAMLSPGILLVDNAGTVVLDRLQVSPAPDQAGIAVYGSTAAVLQDSQVTGMPGLLLADASRGALSAGALDTLELIEASELSAAGVSVPSVLVELGSSLTTFDGVHPHLEVPDLVVLNSSLALELTAAPDTPWIGLFSPGLALLDLMSPAFQMFLLADTAGLLFLPPDMTDGAGDGGVSLELPADPVFLGLKLVFQVITIDAGTGAFRFSNVRSAVPLQ